MLYLISIGLWDEQDLSVRAIRTARKCHKLYAEFYTSNIATNVAKLSQAIGRPVITVERPDLEEHSEKIISEAKTKNIGILVPGDALSATTHIALVLEAKKAGIPVKVIHGSSILTAIGQTGISLYKFGQTVTLPKAGCPPSAKAAIAKNQKAGLHSLILLEPGLDGICGLELLLHARVIKPTTKVVIACCIGGPEIIKWATAKTLIRDHTLAKRPAVLILPGRLHFIEKEFLSLG